MSAASDFTNYPSPKLVDVATEYKNPPHSNPTLSGLPLTVLSHVVASIGPLQSILWKNAGFAAVRALDEKGALEGYEVNHDPTVLPVSAQSGERFKLEAPSPQDPAVSPVFHSAGDFVAAYRSGATTPTAVAERILDLLTNDAAKRRIFISPTPREELLAKAKESTERYASGNPRPLEGVPFVVKDEVDVEGYQKTMGLSSAEAAARIGGPSTATTISVQPFLDAGALFLGKSNMHELGLDTTNNNPNWGTPPNPYNPEYYPGGSSGGSGAAVGAGLVPIAVGADGGGSIRVPATYCGVYGIKPTHGRVDITPTASIAPSVGVVGPIAATASDLKLGYHIMAGIPPSPSSSAALPVLGLYKPWFDDCSPVVHSLTTAALSALALPTIDLPPFPYLAESRTAHALTILNDIGNGFCVGSTTGLTAANKILVSVSRKTTPADIAAAGKLRALLMSHLAALWEQHPEMVVVTPTTPHVGVKIVPGTSEQGGAGVSDSNKSLASMQYVFMANWTGCPAVTMPVGYDEESGMPVGLMAMGKWGSEEALLALAERWEKGWKERRRGIGWVDLLQREAVIA